MVIPWQHPSVVLCHAVDKAVLFSNLGSLSVFRRRSTFGIILLQTNKISLQLPDMKQDATFDMSDLSELV